MMKVELKSHSCVVTREAGDKRLKNESALLHHVKLALIAQGFDVIKKLMWKDGHMVSEYQHYIRTRRARVGTEAIAIFSNFFALRDASEDFNTDGKVTLSVMRETITRKGTE
jgi:hypothetical protein